MTCGGNVKGWWYRILDNTIYLWDELLGPSCIEVQMYNFVNSENEQQKKEEEIKPRCLYRWNRYMAYE